MRPLAAWTVALAVTGGVLSGCSDGGHGSPSAVASPAPTPPSGVALSDLQQMHWGALPPDPLGPRQQAVTAWTGHVLLAVGGTAGTGNGDGPSVAGADAYDPSTRAWQRLPDFPLAVRAAAASAWTGYGLLIWGGEANPVGSGRQTSALRDGAILDVSRRQWHPLPAAPLPALIGPVAVTDATDHVILMGGEPPRPGRGSANEPLASWLVASYDPAKGTWRRLPSLPAVRDHDVDGVNAVAWGKRILVAETWQHTVRTGPSSIEGSGGVDLFLLDPATGRWSTFSARPSAPLVGADLRPLGSFLVVAGGTTCPPMADCAFALDEAVSIVDDRGRASSAVPDSPVQLRAETAVGSSYAVMTGSQFTGRGRVEQPGDTAALDLATKRWVVLPSARRFKPDPESLTWTGRELIAVSPTGLIALEAQ